MGRCGVRCATLFRFSLDILPKLVSRCVAIRCPWDGAKKTHFLVFRLFKAREGGGPRGLGSGDLNLDLDALHGGDAKAREHRRRHPGRQGRRPEGGYGTALRRDVYTPRPGDLPTRIGLEVQKSK